MNLTTENVNDVFLNCLFKEGENSDDHVKAEAVMMTVGFHPERLKANEDNISSMLDDLPDAFRKDAGGGWSFLNMCDTKKGELWTGIHAQIDELVALSIASKKMAYLMPDRKMWKHFAGGMPYLVIN